MIGRLTLQKRSALKFAYCIIQIQTDAVADVSSLPSRHNVQGCKIFSKANSNHAGMFSSYKNFRNTVY